MARTSTWGLRVAWAKQYFEMIPAPSKAAGGGTDRTGISSSDTAGNANPSSRAEKAMEKRLRVMELDPRTAWRCRRCGWMPPAQPGGIEDDATVEAAAAVVATATTIQRGALPRNPVTGRPEFTLLADHLEGTNTRWKKTNSEICETDASGGFACAAGVLVFDKDAHQVPSKESVHEKVPVPTCSSAATGDTKTESHCDKEFQQQDATLPPPVTADMLHKFFTRRDVPPMESSRNGPKKRGKQQTTEDVQPDRTNVSSSGLNDPARVIILLDNPKTPRNIGSILRGLGCFGYATSSSGSAGSSTASTYVSPHCMILFTGHRLLNGLRAQPLSHVGTDATNMRSTIGLFHLSDPQILWRAIRTYKNEEEQSIPQPTLPAKLGDHEAEGSQLAEWGSSDAKDVSPVLIHVTAVDLIASAHSLQDYVHPFSSFPTPSVVSSPGSSPRSTVIMLFGPEDGNLSPDFLPHCNDAVYIPTLGSLNLSTAVTVMLYDRVAKLLRAAAQKESQLQQSVGVEPRKREEEENAGVTTKIVQGGKRGRDEASSSMERCGACQGHTAGTNDLEAVIMRRRNVNNRLEWNNSSKERGTK